MDTSGPNGNTVSATNAGTAEITGARKNTTLSAFVGMMSSLNAIFRPSASACSQPPGPTRFGPGRCCIRPTALRSHATRNSGINIAKANSATTLTMISQRGSWASSASVCCWFSARYEPFTGYLRIP